MTIWFDMDGTIADLYGVDGWLEDLINQNPRPYIEAKPLLNLSLLARRLNKLQKKGYKIGIISWLSKKDDIDYSTSEIELEKKVDRTYILIIAGVILLILIAIFFIRKIVIVK